MKDYTLRSYIPISGPGLREPCRGDESPFRVSIGFTPKWYKDRVGVDFSEKWHRDPVYRYDSLALMKSYLSERFVSIEHFRPRLEDGVDYDCATLSGVYGAVLIPAIYAGKICFFKDNWPSLDASHSFKREDLSALAPFDLEANPIFSDVLAQMDLLEKRWGRISGYLHGFQGVLNTAFRLRGQEIFLDMLDAPQFVHSLFAHICDTIIAVNSAVQSRQRKSGFDINLCTSANCVVNMISPDLYEQFVLPYDQRLSAAFDRYGVHTCNWNATPYIDSIRKIQKVGYIDMGMDTDMERMKQAFPDGRRGVIYNVTKVCGASLREIQYDFERIRAELGHCDIILADIDTNVSDERVGQIIAIADKIAQKG